MKVLFIVNEAPYGSEKAYNALRLAMELQKEQTGTAIRVFLMADAVTAALSGQATPQGYYNIARMLRSVISSGGEVKLCGTCCDARGIKSLPLLEGAEIGALSLLAQWSVARSDSRAGAFALRWSLFRAAFALTDLDSFLATTDSSAGTPENRLAKLSRVLVADDLISIKTGLNRTHKLVNLSGELRCPSQRKT